MRYQDRRVAGRKLAAAMSPEGWERPNELALARGGVPVGAEVAQALGAPLEVIVVRKLGAPAQPEFGIGAVAEDGSLYIDQGTVQGIGLTQPELEQLTARELKEIKRRVQSYRGGRPLPELRGRTVVLVDDGVATGGTLRAAIRAVQALHARQVIVAVPVGASSTLDELRPLVDDLICPLPREDLFSIGQWYDDFHQVSDDEVVNTLSQAFGRTQESRIPVDQVTLGGSLTAPDQAIGIVLFAHGSGSSRHSPRNQYVARVFQEAGLATLLFDLLTEEEEVRDATNAHLRFDLELLANRLLGATEWVLQQPGIASLPLGYFGASTGAGAALIAAATHPAEVRAVVSRGGRPDLAGPYLPRVRAPTLLIVGGDDEAVIPLNEWALDLLHTEKKLVLVPGATHLFEEPGTLNQVAALAGDWFLEHFARRAGRQPVATGPLPA